MRVMYIFENAAEHAWHGIKLGARMIKKAVILGALGTATYFAGYMTLKGKSLKETGEHARDLKDDAVVKIAHKMGYGADPKPCDDVKNIRMEGKKLICDEKPPAFLRLLVTPRTAARIVKEDPRRMDSQWYLTHVEGLRDITLLGRNALSCAPHSYGFNFVAKNSRGQAISGVNCRNDATERFDIVRYDHKNSLGLRPQKK